MKNIGLMIHSLNSGGAERVVSRLSYILAEKYNVYIILFNSELNKYNHAGEVIDLGIKEKNDLPSKIINLFRRVRELKKVKKQYNISTIISFLEGPNFVNILARGNGKSIISIRNFISIENSRDFNGLVIKATSKFLYRKADYIIPVSRVIGESLKSEYKVNEKKIRVIYNPYDIKQIQNDAQKSLEKKYVDFFNDGPVIVSLGRLMDQKGFWHLIKAYKLVKESLPSLKLVIVGEDYLDGKLNKLAKDLDLSDDVLFAGFQENPFPFLLNADLFVMTSIFEGFPNGLVEAMACGKPVIATDCKSGPREILYKKNTNINLVTSDIEYADYGILIPPLTSTPNYNVKDVEEGERLLAKAILELLKNRCKLDEYSKRAIIRTSEFSYKSCKDSFENVIDL